MITHENLFAYFGMGSQTEVGRAAFTSLGIAPVVSHCKTASICFQIRAPREVMQCNQVAVRRWWSDCEQPILARSRLARVIYPHVARGLCSFAPPHRVFTARWGVPA